MVHRCGPGGSMCACHAAGPGSIPGRDESHGWGFFGVFPHLWNKCREALGPQGPRISFGHYYHHHHHQSSFITGANDLKCWRALIPQTYIWSIHFQRVPCPLIWKIYVWVPMASPVCHLLFYICLTALKRPKTLENFIWISLHMALVHCHEPNMAFSQQFHLLDKELFGSGCLIIRARIYM